MNPFKQYFWLLNKHADLVEEVYLMKSVASTPKTERGLEKLESKQILMCDDTGEYRIHPMYKRCFDAMYTRTRVFDTGSPISVEIEALVALSVEIKSASTRGDEEGQSLYTDEAIDAILSLRIEIDRQIRTFDIQTRNGYHDARSMEELQRRNEFYHGRAKQLSDAISTLNSAAVRDLFDGPHTTPVRIRYYKDIIDRIDGWSTRIAGLIQQMLQFMYSAKEIEKRTKRMRAIFHALETVSAGEQVEAIELSEKSLAPVTVATRIRVDYRAEANEAYLMDAARKLDPDATMGRRRMKHAAGDFRGAEILEEEAVHPIEEMISRMITMTREGGTPVSVRNWTVGHSDQNVHDVLMDVFDHMIDGETGIIMQTVPEKSQHFTSCIQDIVLVPC